MRSSQLYSTNSSRRLLILLMAAHILGTIVAYAVYIRFTSLGDGYAPRDFQAYDKLGASFLVHGVYYYLGTLLPSPGHGAGFLAPMTLGLVVAILTWHTFRDIYAYTNRLLFWTCNLLPHFLIWSGTTSKEQLMVILGIIVVRFAAKRSFGASKLNITSLFFVLFSLAFIFYVRPNYCMIYFTIFVTSLFAPTLHKAKIHRFSIGIWALIFILTTMLAIYFASFNATFFNKDVIYWMDSVEMSFLGYEAGSNRTNIQWEDIPDFLYNSLWGIPQGFIGPTLVEAIKRPVQFPFFLEGVVYFFILCYLFVRLFKLAGASPMLRVHILPFYFAALVIVFVSYPYLIFNAGSALRYKQTMHPILIFYPLLILAYARANNFIRKNH